MLLARGSCRFSPRSDRLFLWHRGAITACLRASKRHEARCTQKWRGPASGGLKICRVSITLVSISVRKTSELSFKASRGTGLSAPRSPAARAQNTTAGTIYQNIFSSCCLHMAKMTKFWSWKVSPLLDSPEFVSPSIRGTKSHLTASSQLKGMV